MTDTSAPAEVVQADRDAAADLLLERGMTRTLASNVRSGAADQHHVVQAFARHRLNAQPLAADARAAGTVEALKPFAEAAENLDDSHNDRFDIWESSAAMSITAGDLRHAHKLYAALSSGKTVGADSNLQKAQIAPGVGVLGVSGEGPE
jgi:hypothetical protein